MAIKTYINDGQDHKDGLGAYPGDIPATESGAWYIEFERDKNLRDAVRESNTAGIQIKNASDYPVRVKIEGSSLAELVVAKKSGESVIVDHPSGILIRNMGPGTILANTLVITVTTGANAVSGATGLGDIYVTQDFNGDAYSLQYTASDDSAHPLLSESKKLADVVIRCSGNAALIGDNNNQYFQLNVGDILGITKIDISTLYVKNASAGQNTTITLFGVEI